MVNESENTFYEDPRALVSHIIGKINDELAIIFENVHSKDEYPDSVHESLKSYSRALRQSPTETVIKEVISGLMTDIDKLRENNSALKRDVKKSVDSIKEIEGELEKAQKESMYDGLTRLYNRRAFEKRIEEIFDELNRYGNAFCLAFVDIDNFKQVNDTRGHRVGDLVLEHVGQQIRKNLRISDVGCRYGGEEFIAVFSNTSLPKGCFAAERLRVSIQDSPVLIGDEEAVRITVSIGLSEAKKGMTAEELINRADQAMYLAKKESKNAVKTEDDL